MEPLLIERADEISRLQRACRDLVAGTGTYVHVVGEAGIGKTSLLRRAERDLRDRGVTLLQATTDETDSRRQLAVVRRLLPTLNLTGGDAVDDALAAIERLANSGPTAVLVDDLHWVDRSSLEVLWALARRAIDLGVFLLTASRGHASSGTLARLEDLAAADGVCLRPKRFDADALAALVEHRLGASPGPRLAAALEGTAGNPFLAVELLAAFSNDGTVTIDGGTADLTVDPPLPEELSRRLAVRALSTVPNAEIVLRAIAAIPGGAKADELAELVGQPLGEIVGVLVGSVDAGVLVDNGESLDFRHDLLRRAVLGATPKSVVHSLARQCADVLVRLHSDPDRIAACLIGSADVSVPVDVDYLVARAREFRSTHPVASSDLLALAVESLESNDARFHDLIIELGWALIAAGRSSEVHSLLAERFGRYRDSEPIEVSRLRGIAAGLTGDLESTIERYAHLDVGQLSDSFDEFNPELVDAVAELGFLRVSTGELADAEKIIDWVEASPTPSSPFRAATVSTVRGFIDVAAGSFELGLDHARAALDAVSHDQLRRASAATPLLVEAIALDLLGDSEAALAVTRNRGRSATPRWGPALLQFFSTLTLFRRGDWDDALAEVDTAFASADDSDMAMAVFWPSAVATLIASARDQPARAHAWLRRSQTLGGQRSLGREWVAYAAAVVAEADGDTEGALALVEMIVEGLTEANAPAMFLNGGAEMTRVCRNGGRTHHVRSILSALEHVQSSTASPVAAAVLAWSTGLAERDAATIAGAAEELASCHRVPEAARAFHDASVESAGVADFDTARRLAKAACETYDVLDASQWRRRLISDLRLLGLDVRPRRGPQRAVEGWASLTGSEEAVVALVGEGLTNTEIADRLFVSRRTVESHLRRVYPKLRLSNRAQLVAAVVRRCVGTGGELSGVLLSE